MNTDCCYYCWVDEAYEAENRKAMREAFRR